MSIGGSAPIQICLRKSRFRLPAAVRGSTINVRRPTSRREGQRELARGVDVAQVASTLHAVSSMDYRQVDLVEEIRRLTGDDVDIAFDGIGGAHVWQSFKLYTAPNCWAHGRAEA